MRRSPVFLACALLCAATASCKTTSSTTPTPATAASSADPAPTPSTPASTSGGASTGAPPGPAGPPGSVGTPPAGSAMVNGSTDVSGDRTLADITAIITKNRDKFRSCYDQAQRVTNSLKGKYVIVFELKPSGELKTAVVDEKNTEIKDPGMDRCAITELQKLTFPPSKQGKETKVSYPFTFTPGGAGPAKLERQRPDEQLEPGEERGPFLTGGQQRARLAPLLRCHRCRPGAHAQRGQFPRR